MMDPNEDVQGLDFLLPITIGLPLLAVVLALVISGCAHGPSPEERLSTEATQVCGVGKVKSISVNRRNDGNDTSFECEGDH
jgi:hypothetical protein